MKDPRGQLIRLSNLIAVELINFENALYSIYQGIPPSDGSGTFEIDQNTMANKLIETGEWKFEQCTEVNCPGYGVLVVVLQKT